MAQFKREQALGVGVVAILLLAFFLRVWGLSGTALTGDEISSAISAANYVEGGSLGPTMWNHPNLRNLLLYGSLSAGLSPVWSIKAASLVLGSLTVLFLALVAKEVTGSWWAALAAAFMLAVDPLHIDFSRQAVHEVYMACFSLGGAWLTLVYLRTRRQASLVAAGIFFGLGISSKWEPLFPLVVMFAFTLKAALPNMSKDRSGGIVDGIFATACLAAIPATVYLLTWLPWFLHGKDLGDLLVLHREMFLETTSHAGYNAYNYTISFRAWEWFVKPVEFVDVIFGADKVRILIGIANPAVWCLVLPALAYVIFQAIKRRNERYTVAVALFLFSYTPFVATSRPIWAHSAFTVLCFGIVMVAATLVTLFPQGQLKRVVPAYLALVLLVSAPLYPLATGEGENFHFLRPLVEKYRPAHER